MNNLKLRQILLFSMISVGLIPLIIAAFISTNSAANSLEKQGFAQLQSIRQIKGEAIKRHFEESLNIIKTTSLSPVTLDAAVQLKRSFNDYLSQSIQSDTIEAQRQQLATYYHNEFGKKYDDINQTQLDPAPLYKNISATAVALQHSYIFDNAAQLGSKDELYRGNGGNAYHSHHETFHGYFRQILQDFGYYDIFLIDPGSGAIFYSVFKELDYATSLLTGPYADTNFAEVFKQTAASKEIHTIDFRRYQPSYEAPASFQAAPVIQNGELVAVLVFQLPIEPINGIMASRAGMGETGETYLVGEDKLMRSDSYLQPETHSVSASFANPDTGKVETEAVRESLAGKSDTKIIIDYLGNPVLSSYERLDFGDFSWVILAEMDEAEAFAPVNSLRNLVILVILMAIVAIISVALFIAKTIAAPINQIAQTMETVERTSDFSIRINNQANNEIGTISKAFDNLLHGLKDSFSDTKSVLNQVSSGDYSVQVSRNYSGDILDLKQGINATIAAIQKADTESINQKRVADEKASEAAKSKQEAEEQKQYALTQAKDAAHQKELAMEAQKASEQKAAEAQRALQEASNQKQIAESKAREAAEVANKAQEAEVSANRIKQALDNVSTNAFVCNASGEIIYSNQAMNELLPKLNLSGVSGDLTGSLITSVFSDKEVLASIGSAREGSKHQLQIADTFLNVAINGIKDESGNVSGTVIELNNRTEEVLAQREIDHLVSAASQGDLSTRVSEKGKQGFFLDIAKGLNRLNDVCESAINEVGEVLEAMANGQLTKQVTGDFQGAFGHLQNNVNDTVSKLTRVIQEIDDSASHIANNAKGITQGNFQISDRTQSLASALEQSSASMEEMTTTVSSTAKNASSATKTAETARQLAEEGGLICAQAIASMNEIGEASTKINNIISVIDEIAFQTNLLALNASVEAARAGEQGRGFAVVAGEVRNLAQRAAAAAKEIKDLISDSVNKVESGSTLVNKSGESLRQIIDAVNTVSIAISDIASASDQQVSGIQQVNSTISDMERATQQNASLVEEAASAVEKMESETTKMSEQMGFFTTT